MLLFLLLALIVKRARIGLISIAVLSLVLLGYPQIPLLLNKPLATQYASVAVPQSNITNIVVLAAGAFAMIADAGFDGACIDPSVAEIGDPRKYAHLFAEHGLGSMVNAFPYSADDMAPLLDFAVEMDACMVNVISGVMPIKPEDAVAGAGA